MLQYRRQITRIAAISFMAILAAGFIAFRLTAQGGALPNQSHALPVRTTTVELQDGYHARRTFTGRAIPGRISQLAFELGGTVKSVSVDLGSRVDAGTPLAELDKSRLEATLARLNGEKAEVAASLSLAERTLQRARETFSQGHSSAQHLDEAEANVVTLKARATQIAAAIHSAEIDLRKSAIVAPYAGVITQRLVDEGTVVAGGTAIVELSETGQLEAHIGMSPELARAVEAGAPVELRDGRRNIIDGATLRSIVPVIEGQTRTMMVTFNLPEGSAARGELVTALVNDWQEARGAWLPLRALSSDVRGLWRVYKVVEQNGDLQVRFENVQILYTDGNRVYVTGTISSGDRVIADGIERLAPGQRVTELPPSDSVHG